MSELTGIFARGKLLGYAKVVDKYNDSHGVQQSKEVHLLGIERETFGKFGEIRQSTLPLVIPAEKLNDQEFMLDVRQFIGHTIEIGLSGYTDYSKSRRPYISNDAKIISLSAEFDAGHQLKAAS